MSRLYSEDIRSKDFDAKSFRLVKAELDDFIINKNDFNFAKNISNGGNVNITSKLFLSEKQPEILILKETKESKEVNNFKIEIYSFDDKKIKEYKNSINDIIK